MSKWWVSFFLLFSMKLGAVEVSCVCPKLACDPCSRERGVTFYTEKCGEHDSQVKSCSRPTCLPIENPTEACPNPPKSKGAREPVIVEDVPKVDVNTDVSRGEVGKVKVIKGSVTISAQGKLTVVKGSETLRETDAVISGADSTALVEFNGGNKVHVHPETNFEVSEYKNQDQPNARKALLKLVKGKIRNQVKQKYNGKTSSYEVQTRAAIAGVRGTDFVVEQVEGGSSETRVETLEGHVSLSDKAQKELREIAAGEGAVYTDKLGPVYKIAPEKLRELDMASRVDVARAKKPPAPKPSDEKEICDKPKAHFNQCHWRQVNGKCLRQRCNANGQWAEETVVTSSCPAGVSACDY